MKKFAVILAGCGVYDGAEIHEAVLTLLAIDKAGAGYQVFAPDIQQMHVVNHLSGEVTGETRNVLSESARIARGSIKPLTEFDPADFDAMVLPGGFGVAKNLCDYAVAGPKMKVLDIVEDTILKMAGQHKPVGAMCIAPVVLARLFPGAVLTIGSDKNVSAHIKEMGGHHQNTSFTDVVSDEKFGLFTTPCYMLDASVSQIAAGAEHLIRAMISFMNEKEHQVQ